MTTYLLIGLGILCWFQSRRSRAPLTGPNPEAGSNSTLASTFYSVAAALFITLAVTIHILKLRNLLCLLEPATNAIWIWLEAAAEALLSATDGK
jgi:hypothetical protein